MAHTLVIVESPTKARTIRGFLPKDFKVEASMGHVRDLPNNASEIPAAHKGEKWANLGVNTTNDFEPLYVVPKDKKKTVKELKDALKGADQLLLATDEDREGESISWHLLQLLNPKVPVKRMVFHEITKVFLVFALTKDLLILKPLFVCAVVSFVISRITHEHSIYQRQLAIQSSSTSTQGEMKLPGTPLSPREL